MRKPRRIVVLVVPPIEELDLVGPVQVLSTATRLIGRRGTPYDICVVSTTRDRVIAGESDSPSSPMRIISSSRARSIPCLWSAG